eukprot:NODE_465_length_8145_cov_0.434999.p5 type:complete len:185 gc:universal NODE_465_length_8145_cov_0.434999:5934-6488(+)
MEREIRKANRKLKNTTTVLTIWFVLVILVSIGAMVGHQYLGIMPILLNLGYIYTLFQQDYRIKRIGLLIHMIFSGLVGIIGGFILVYMGLTYQQSAKDLDPIISVLITVFVFFMIVYSILTFVFIFEHQEHCKSAKLLMKNGIANPNQISVYNTSVQQMRSRYNYQQRPTHGDAEFEFDPKTLG